MFQCGDEEIHACLELCGLAQRLASTKRVVGPKQEEYFNSHARAHWQEKTRVLTTCQGVNTALSLYLV